MSKKKVYVSSTFVDLKEHRLKVKEALERAQYDVECMEKYPAFDERPKDKCLNDVAACDYYVLILAHRYGFVPNADNPTKKSITHLEYEQANACGKPILPFVIREEHSWPDKMKDRGSLTSRSRVGAFRNGVRERHGAPHFTTPDNLAMRVLEALRAREEKEWRTGRDVEKTAPLPIYRWPTPWDFTAYVESKREGFIGREWLFTEIEEWLRTGTQKALLIRADFGVGKSAMMAEILRRNPGGAVAAAHFCQHDTQDTLHPATFVRSLAAQFRDSIPGYREAIESDAALQEQLDSAQDTPAGVFEAAILNMLAKLPPPSNTRLLLVDALDEGLELDKEGTGKIATIVSLLAAKASRIPAWLRIMVTSRNNPAVIVPLQQCFSIKEIDAEDNRNQDDLDHYVRSRCTQRSIAAKLQASARNTESVVTLLRHKSEGKFLYAVRALNDLANETLKLDDLDQLPPGMDGFYLDAFNRRFSANFERYKKEVRDALGVLVEAREPVPPPMLAAVLGRNETTVKQALAMIPDFIRVRDGGYGFDHFSLAEWLTLENQQLTPRAGRYAVDLPESRERIRSWALQQVDAKQAYKYPYLLRHLAAHLEEAERADIFSKLMFDSRWLKAKVLNAGVHSLLADCALLRRQESSRLLLTALRNSLSAIKRDVRQMAPQLLGRLAREHPSAEIQTLCESLHATLADFTPALIPQTASLWLTSALLVTLQGHEESVTALAVLPDGRLASASDDQTVRIWETSGHSEPLVLKGHEERVTALAVLPDGRLASASSDDTVRIWETSGRGEPLVLKGHESLVTALAMLPDGRLASASFDQTVRIWETSGHSEPLVLTGHESPVTALAVLPDGRLASASWDHTVRIWETTGHSEPLVLTGHEAMVNRLAVLPDGRLASASDDGALRIWETSGRREPLVLTGHEAMVNALAVLPDGRLASASSDRTVRIWETSGRGEPLVLKGHEDVVSELAVLPDGRLASASDDGTLRIWDLRTGTMVTMFVADGIISALVALPSATIVAGDFTGAVHFLSLVER